MDRIGFSLPDSELMANMLDRTMHSVTFNPDVSLDACIDRGCTIHIQICTLIAVFHVEFVCIDDVIFFFCIVDAQ